jgi:hypothetical protein
MFTVFGGQDVGLKAKDLQDGKTMLEMAGFQVPGGMVVAAEVFDRFIAERNFTDSTGISVIGWVEPTEEIKTINREILSRMTPGQPYAIRSSARSERGGNGIYVTDFFTPKGGKEIDSNLHRLWMKQCGVYFSEFSMDARIWRQKENLPMGMALLIQSAVADYDDFDQGYFPILSGRAYTIYHGHPLVRFTSGFAFEYTLERKPITEPPPREKFVKMIKELPAALSLRDDIFLDTDIPWKKLYEIGPNILEHLFACLKRLQEQQNGQDFYLEWAVRGSDPDAIHILQCAPYDDFKETIWSSDDDMEEDESLPEKKSLIQKPGYVLLAEGIDIVNSGTRTGHSIILLEKSEWYRNGVAILEKINLEQKDFILILPQEAFSSMAFPPQYSRFDEGNWIDRQIGLRHFSHAAAVVEDQHEPGFYDALNLAACGLPIVRHSGNMGGMHFQQLCERTDILFLGAEVDLQILMRFPYKYQDGDKERGIIIWEMETEIVNDPKTRTGCLFLKTPENNR